MPSQQFTHKSSEFFPIFLSTNYIEPVRKVLVLAVRDFSRPPFFHTSPKKTRFFSILAFLAQKTYFWAWTSFDRLFLRF
jgi:hypothetical protein